MFLWGFVRVKPHNEDACGIRIPEEPLLTSKGFAVAIADGLSGSDAGREASEACVQGFLNDYFSTPDSWSTKTAAHKVLSALNRWLYGQGQREYGSTRGMVTTLSVVIVKSNTAYLLHIGDTRIYRLRNNLLEPLTKDHRLHVGKNKAYLTHAMGIDLNAEIDFKTTPVEVGDILILMTDGVYEFISNQHIKDLVIQHEAELEQAAYAIVKQAQDNGSDDNLTCQVVKIEQLPNKNEQEFYHQLTKLPFPPPLEPDMILDGYRILRELFSNKRSEIYLAQDIETAKRVVLKAPSINYKDDPNYINQFLHEEWVGRRINNPHVVKVHEIRRHRQCLYYITEHIRGKTLRQWMADNPQPSLDKVRDMVQQLSNGLRAFQRLEMIHQDLKPENIMIDEHGTLKIIDFGSTKIAGIEEISTPLDTDNLLGTINYTTPEYHSGITATNRSDIFSLGVIAYELLTTKLPYGKTLTPRNIQHAHYQPAKKYNTAIPLWVDKTLEKAVRIDPQLRYGSLSEFTFDLAHPNMTFMTKDHVPLLESNPTGFWRTLALILLIINSILVYYLLR